MLDGWKTKLATVGIAALLSLLPNSVSAKQAGKLDYSTLTTERAVELCDLYASHPSDPLKPTKFAGVLLDADVAHDNAYIACNKAFISDQNNPRFAFQWARVNFARNPKLPGQPRYVFTHAYRHGSEIAGIYLAKLPPEKTFAQLQSHVQQRMREMRNQQRSRPMTGAERDEMLIGSLITIGSLYLVALLTGKAKAPSQECSGGFVLDVNTHDVLCNGLIVSHY